MFVHLAKIRAGYFNVPVNYMTSDVNWAAAATAVLFASDGHMMNDNEIEAFWNHELEATSRRMLAAEMKCYAIVAARDAFPISLLGF